MATDKKVFIVSAVRTPIGAFAGGLSTVSSSHLGSTVIAEALLRCSLEPQNVSEVIMGQVLNALQGQNPARQAAVLAGIPYSVPATGISMACGSGLRAVMLGAQAIKCGDASIVVSGGQESMSQSVHGTHMRGSRKFGHFELTDTMLKDGLTDAFHNCHMGITAENLASKYSISRCDQDDYALNSQLKVARALESNYFEEEIVPVRISVRGKKSSNESDFISKDEYPRPQTTLEMLSLLRPVFIKDTGTVTAGNASGLNDGAAAVVLMNEKELSDRKLQPLATVISYALAGVEPDIMGIGPVPAIKQAIINAGWTLDDVDLFEINEAFSSQVLSVIAELKVDTEKVNVHGGSISLGHPIGASGCRVLVTLIYAMRRKNVKRGCASLCMGGGMGIAMCIENSAFLQKLCNLKRIFSLIYITEKESTAWKADHNFDHMFNSLILKERPIHIRARHYLALNEQKQLMNAILEFGELNQDWSGTAQHKTNQSLICYL